MIRQQLFIGAALVAGVAVGYFLKPERTEQVAPAKTEVKSPRPIADKGENAEIFRLKSRIRDLEKQLAALQSDTNDVVAASEEPAGKPKDSPPQFKSHRERMEAMKRDDPARYTRMTNHIANMHRNMLARQQSKIDILSSIDTSGMSTSAKSVHDKLQALLETRKSLEEQLSAGDELSDDERHQIFTSMRETDNQIRDLNRSERSNLIDEVAKAVGLQGDDAKDFSATISEVIEATDSNAFGPRGGQPPPPTSGR